jgi:hypothetical protein
MAGETHQPVASDLYPLIYKFLIGCGMTKAAKQFASSISLVTLPFYFLHFLLIFILPSSSSSILVILGLRNDEI